MDSFHQSESDDNDKNCSEIANNLFLTNLLSTLPNLDSLQNKRYLFNQTFVNINTTTLVFVPVHETATQWTEIVCFRIFWIHSITEEGQVTSWIRLATIALIRRTPSIFFATTATRRRETIFHEILLLTPIAPRAPLKVFFAVIAIVTR